MKPLSETYEELGISFTFPIEIKDANGNRTYYENSKGFSWKAEYNSDGRETYCENTNGFCRKSEYDAEGNAYYKDIYVNKRVTPRKSCDGKVIEIDGQKYMLKEL